MENKVNFSSLSLFDSCNFVYCTKSKKTPTSVISQIIAMVKTYRNNMSCCKPRGNCKTILSTDTKLLIVFIAECSIHAKCLEKKIQINSDRVISEERNAMMQTNLEVAFSFANFSTAEDRIGISFYLCCFLFIV